MSLIIIVIMAVLLLFRLFTVFISSKNEKKLKQSGAVEYGQLNTKFLVVVHIIIYVAAFLEAYIKKISFDIFTIAGISLYILSAIVLLFVISQLKDLWTVKLIIAKEHKLNTSFIFDYFKHPNYFLNVIPEIIAVNLICKSWNVLLFIVPIYMLFLIIRIVQEEKVMKEVFTEY